MAAAGTAKPYEPCCQYFLLIKPTEPHPDKYLIQVDLEPLTHKGKKPICRRLSFPASTTFSQLHDGLQDSFQWQDYHAWEFSVRDCGEWNKKTARSEHLVCITEWPNNLGSGPPEKRAEKLTLGGILEDNKYKGKAMVTHGTLAGTGIMSLW
jgi:hypothetical protein